MNCSGIGSVPGDSGDSQASVQAFLSSRAGLPVHDRERTVSREVAFRMCSLASSGVSASSTVSHSEPVQTPSAPSASPAAIWRPEPMPPAASTGTSTASTTWGMRTIVEMSPVWPPASVPCATTTSTPTSTCLTACRGVEASAATLTPRAWASSTTSAGGGPSALASSAMGCLSAVSTWGRAVASVQPSSTRPASECSDSGGTPCWASRFSTNCRWPSGIIAWSRATRSSGESTPRSAPA